MEQFSIGANFEGAAARRNESERRDALAEFENFGRQTDGLRRVVSNDAVFDRHFGFHSRLLSDVKLSARLNAVKTLCRQPCRLLTAWKCRRHACLYSCNPLTISRGGGRFAPFRFAGSAAKII